ncbi:hypothetical protein DXG03_006569 [Asterophora parasitica]|uniref:Carboxypeptidase n=1 Tax=Asterophora parasitica TaxID=117018 RepID=A0A9P7GE03_9AGAR|nr:hypothetical protein DXG03_006569 [Asterophora parasitica]
MGLLMELGPCSIDMKNATGNGTLWNPHSWNEEANIFFLDQPVGVGFSYADFGETVETTEEAAKNIHAFLTIFFETFKQFSGRALHLSGESYGGRYLPVFASEIYDQNEVAVREGRQPLNLKSVLIGNGITDISTLYAGRYEVECGTASLDVPFQTIGNCVRMKTALPRCEKALQRGCIEQFDSINCRAAVNFCDSELSTAMWATGKNVYDISKPCEGDLCYAENGAIKRFLDLPSTRALLGVESSAPFSACSDAVGESFAAHLDKWAHPTQYYVAGLLDRGVRVLIYAGTYDWQCNWVANKLWLEKLVWGGSEEYQAGAWRDWSVEGDGKGKKAGETKSARGLTFATIRGAGHMMIAGDHGALAEEPPILAGVSMVTEVPGTRVQLSELERVLDLWFEDADMVFQAEMKVFRLHGKTLASSSTVFEGMLSFPQPNPPERVEDCPLIRMPDSAHDVAIFFKAIVDPLSFMPPPAQTDLRTLLAVLRLGHKYQVTHLSKIALRHLTTAYPTTLQGWDSRLETRTFPSTKSFNDEFQLLRAVLKHGASWALPALFYSCGAYPMQEILDSTVWIEAGDLLLEKNLCLLGYAEQFAASLKVMRFLVQPTPSDCSDRLKCYPSRLTWFDMVDTWRPSIPLEIWDEGDWKRYAREVCAACLEESRRAHRKARAAVWENLPKTYRLAPWDQL